MLESRESDSSRSQRCFVCREFAPPRRSGVRFSLGSFDARSSFYGRFFDHQTQRAWQREAVACECAERSVWFEHEFDSIRREFGR